MRTKINRPISAEEAEVIRLTMERAASAPNLENLDEYVTGLQVVGKCNCGCDSIDFVGHGEVSDAKPIADGIGSTPRGGKVGVIVWGTSQTITGLEIYDLGSGPDDIKLPVPSSIASFEKGKV